MLRYTDKKLTDDTKVPGFASLFRAAPESQKFFAYFPSVVNSDEDEWIAYFNRIRQERFESVTATRSRNAFYRFQSTTWKISSSIIIVCLVVLQSRRQSCWIWTTTIKTLKGKFYRFERIRKLTESIGICKITNL